MHTYIILGCRKINTIVIPCYNHQIALTVYCRGRDCLVVGFTTTYAISAYHH